MNEFRARIGRVRMKNGGADVHVLDNRLPNLGGEENWCGKVVENARRVASFSTEDSPLIGYLLLGIYADGHSSFGFRYDRERCPFPTALLPAWIAELVRRDMVTRPECAEVFNDKFEWREG